jgi:hypothetical protein
MTGQATFWLEEEELEDLDGVLAVSAGFLAAGLSAVPLPLPLELDSVEEEAAGAGEELASLLALFRLSVR